MDSKTLAEINTNVRNYHYRLINKILVIDFLNGENPTYNEIARESPAYYIEDLTPSIKKTHGYKFIGVVGEDETRIHYPIPIISLNKCFDCSNNPTSQINAYINNKLEMLLFPLLDKASMDVNKVITCNCKKLTGKTNAIKKLLFEIQKWHNFPCSLLCNYNTFNFIAKNISDMYCHNGTYILFGTYIHMSNHIEDNVLYSVVDPELLGVMPIEKNILIKENEEGNLSLSFDFGMCVLNCEGVAKLIFKDGVL